jgi:hypothetical protein
MFLIPTVEIVIDGWSDKKEKLMNLYEQEKLERIKDDTSTLYTSYYSDSDEHQINKIKEILEDEINFFANVLDIKGCALKDAWFQRYENQDHHSIHTHGALGYSFVCFVEFNANYHLPTTFISPFTDFLTGNCLNFSPNVHEGSIIFFPSNIMHYAPINTSKEVRTILSGNLKISRNSM